MSLLVSSVRTWTCYVSELTKCYIAQHNSRFYLLLWKYNCFIHTSFYTEMYIIWTINYMLTLIVRFFIIWPLPSYVLSLILKLAPSYPHSPNCFHSLVPAILSSHNVLACMLFAMSETSLSWPPHPSFFFFLTNFYLFFRPLLDCQGFPGLPKCLNSPIIWFNRNMYISFVLFITIVTLYFVFDYFFNICFSY